MLWLKYTPKQEQTSRYTVVPVAISSGFVVPKIQTSESGQSQNSISNT